MLSAEIVERVIRWSGARAGIALVYHSVAPVAGDPARELVAPHGADLFEAQLRMLADRYRVVRAVDLSDAAAGRRRGEPIPVALTFDDDLRSHADVAAPILTRLGLPATFFLCGASLDRPFSFWWERLQRAFDGGQPGLPELARIPSSPAPTVHALGEAVESMRPAERDRASAKLLELAGPDPPDAGLRREDVAALRHAGFDVGFHTLRHDRLPDLTDAELTDALASGGAAITDVIGAELRLIAYPHGRADRRVAAAAQEAGYRFGFTDWPISITRRSNPLLLGRLVPSRRSERELSSQLAKTLLRGLSPREARKHLIRFRWWDRARGP